MNISILGTGTMASGLAVLFTKAGHAVTAASRDPVKARTRAAELDNGISGASLADAAADSDSVVLAVPHDAAAEVIGAAGGLVAARYLEPVAGLNIALGYGLGHGTDIAPSWQGIA